MPRLIALAAVLTLGIAVSASAAPRTTSESLTIRLISTRGDVRHVDLAPKGRPNRGDTLTVTTSLMNDVPQFGRPRGALVGSDVIFIRFLSPKTWLTTFTVHLPGGTMKARIPVVANSRDRATISIPVTGGTGRFAGARGVLFSTDVNSDLALNVYRLRLP